MKLLRIYFQHLWYGSKHSWLDKCVLFCLKPLSLIYAFFFYIILFFKKNKKVLTCNKFRVISVGNLAVGGTGKTVFTQFLLDHVRQKQGAVVLRGYGGSVSKSQESRFVSDGQEVVLSPAQAGDEAVMLAMSNNVPIVVGQNRAASCLLLESKKKSTIDYVILDDSYQNFQVKKDVSILLVDGRYRWSQCHRLPAGFLREADVSRADFIVLTHAAHMADYDKDVFALSVAKNIPLFLGRVSLAGVFVNNKGNNIAPMLKEQYVLLAAGIGNISGFEKSVASLGVQVVKTLDFGDHYEYTKQDVQALVNHALQKEVSFIITTSKDWVKLESIVLEGGFNQVSWCVLRIGFEFLTTEQYHLFVRALYKKLEW